jgi:hypothetical protein
MTNRRERLNLLTVAEPCPEPWETMAGDGATRHCARCNRSVHDFAALSPLEIERLLRRGRGQVCGRLTRRPDGQLLTREERLPSSNEVVERPSRLAAALVAGLLGGLGAPLGAETPAQPGPEAATDPRGEPSSRRDLDENRGASLFGRITGVRVSASGWSKEPVANFELRATNLLDGATVATFSDADGRFVFSGLATGMWRIEGWSDAWTVTSPPTLALASNERRQVDLGARAGSWASGRLLVSRPPLWNWSEEAKLVVSGVVGRSTPVDSEDDFGWTALVTELHVTSIFAGDPGSAVIRLVRYGSLDPAEDELPPGSSVFALLEPGEEPGTWQETHSGWCFVLASDEEASALGRRVAEIAELDLREPASLPLLADWLVESALDPLTREGSIADLEAAVLDLVPDMEKADRSFVHAAEDRRGLLRAFEREGGKLASPFPKSLPAAFLTDEHRKDLTRALLASPLSKPNFQLFKVVERWAPELAREWLIDQVRKSGLTDDLDGWTIARELAARLEGEAFREIASHYASDSELKEALDRFREAFAALPAQRF